MKRSLALPSAVLACFTLFCGCKQSRSERVAASYSSVSKPTILPVPPAVRAPQKATVGIEAIPTEEDYEERALATINEANLIRKLAELEKEMAF
jgi:hypothetical protein